MLWNLKLFFGHKALSKKNTLQGCVRPVNYKKIGLKQFFVISSTKNLTDELFESEDQKLLQLLQSTSFYFF